MPGARSAGRWVDRAIGLVPLLFAVPVLGGVAVSLVRLLATGDPDAKFGTTVNADAAALWLGQPLYQDPGDGYSGILYGPLLPIVVSVLFRATIWTGWPLLLTILATLAMVGLAARLAYRPVSHAPAGRALAVLEALGIGALGWAVAASIQLNGIFGGNGMHDQVAWALGLAGLLLMPSAARSSRVALVGAVLLLSAAFWTKQNTIIASLAAVGWLGLGAMFGSIRPRRAVAFAVALLGLNVALLGAANLYTSGWEVVFNFIVPSRHPLGDLAGSFYDSTVKFVREDLLPASTLALAVAAVTWLGVGVGRVRHQRARSRRGEGPPPLALARATTRRLGTQLRSPRIVGLPLVVTLVAAVAFRRAEKLNLYFLTAPSERGKAFLEGLLFPGLILLVLLVALLAATLGAREGLRRRRAAAAPGSPPDAVPIAWGLGSLLAVFLAVGIPLSFVFRQKVGADDNYYVGLVWAVAFVGALGWRRARARRDASLVAAAGLLALFAAMAVISPGPEAEGRQNAVNLPELARTDPGQESESWLTVFFPRTGLVPLNQPDEVAPDLRAYARTHLVYSDGYGDLNVRPQGLVWPNYDNFSGNLAGGIPPGYLLEAWLDRRFDAVSGPFETDERKEEFASGGGQWEENYLWKLNAVIRAGYEKRTVLPEDLWERRPGPSAAPWMRTCFGPFEVGGTAWRINRGGGFWCRPPGTDRLELRDTPAPYSDVRTTGEVTSAEGALGVALPRPGAFDVSFEREGEPPTRLHGTPAPGGGVLLSVYRGTTPTGRATVPGRRGVRGPAVELTLTRGADPGALRLSVTGPGRATLGVPSLEGGAVLRLGATRGSGARFELARLRTG
ncbi:MAG: hypothetical protein ACR2NV_13195 [Thermoleophilaceae bacterium]